MRLLGWALSQYDWCPSKKKRSGYKHTQKKDHMKTQKDGWPFKAKRRDPQKKTTLPTP